jgi:hypothetical protein
MDYSDLNKSVFSVVVCTKILLGSRNRIQRFRIKLTLDNTNQFIEKAHGSIWLLKI